MYSSKPFIVLILQLISEEDGLAVKALDWNAGDLSSVPDY